MYYNGYLSEDTDEIILVMDYSLVAMKDKERKRREKVFNSDFLHNNAPFNSEFGLKKLDDGIIILESSVLGEETKEINQLKNCKEKVEKRQKKIKDENSTETLSAKQESEIKKYDEEIEKIRKK
ncbi:hypothetical protein HpHA126_08140 [Helicobacter pylori]